MIRVQQVRLLRPAALFAGAGLGLFVVGCQGPDAYFRGPLAGAAGDLGTGTGGDIGPGTGGNVGPGAGGNVGPGAGGSVGPGTGGAGPTGTAGSTGGSGAAGTAGTAGGGGTGSAGRGGTTGAAGSAAGRGGTTGAGGAGGAGGRGGGAGSGAAGTTGAGGSTGAAGRGGATGSAGRGGATGGGGRGGAAGTGGAGGGATSCPLGGRLDCSAAGALDLAPDGQVVDFSAGQWNNTTDKWCNADGLDGGLFSFAGTGSMAAVDVDTTARNLKLNLTVSAGQYAGGGVNFDSCVDARAFNAIQFTASISAGSLNGCTWQIQLQTRDQIPTTDTDPSGGSCNATTTTCRRHPAATLTAATMTATTFTTRFTAFNNPAGSTTATASQVVGLQWQVNSGNSGSGTCTVELRIDNAKFVTQ